MKMTHYQKRWLVAILHYTNLICLNYLLISHVLSLWNIGILGGAVPAVAVAGAPIFFASVLHQMDRLHLARYGEKRPAIPDTAEDYRRGNQITLDLVLGYRSLAPVSMPYAPRWLVSFAAVACLVWLPYSLWLVFVSLGLPYDLGMARAGSVWISWLYLYSLPILSSWRRELVIEPDT